MALRDQWNSATGAGINTGAPRCESHGRGRCDFKKAFRYWWLPIIAFVVSAPVLIIQRIPTGSGWSYEWRWLSRNDYKIGRSDFLWVHSNGTPGTRAFSGEDLSLGVFAIRSEHSISPDLLSPEILPELKAIVMSHRFEGVNSIVVRTD